uniref:Superoxide dismutase [Cu-Zn] n=1 Tax=Anthurium amnicola TaxID=1678845 RepID=A0A1D1ZJ21_9ARAE
MNVFTKSLFFVIFVTLGVLITSNRVNGSDIKRASAEFKDKVQGFINFIFDPDYYDGEATIVAIFEKGSGLEIGKNYLYRIHENPITNNDCETAGGVLDPNQFGSDPGYKCDPTVPEKCEVGDLSGKYGDLIPDDDGEVIKSVIDSFVKLDGPSGITGRSVVIRLDDKNQTIIACANILNVSNNKRKRNRRFVF